MIGPRLRCRRCKFRGMCDAVRFEMSTDERKRRDQRRQELGAKLRACGGVTGDWPLEPENTVEAVRKEKST